jgi:hypothetical protein
MENVADMLQNIKHIVLTWSLTSQTLDMHFRQSMQETLKSMLDHLQTGDGEMASDSGVDDGTSKVTTPDA